MSKCLISELPKRRQVRCVHAGSGPIAGKRASFALAAKDQAVARADPSDASSPRPSTLAFRLPFFLGFDPPSPVSGRAVTVSSRRAGTVVVSQAGRSWCRSAPALLEKSTFRRQQQGLYW
jgi:hypothetical protein